jgi:glycosyltransferase involved in cell wall biosynthesis
MKGRNLGRSCAAGIDNIGFVGTYTPRRCGIATFGADLVTAVAQGDNEPRINFVALNDRPDTYPYPEEVKFEIAQNALGQYLKAADFLNMNLLDAVCVQHEFGIYGGSDGAHILKLMRQLHMPVVVTLHTILNNPSCSQRELIREMADVSDCLVVMSETGKRCLEEVYEVASRSIAVIPHGIPDVPFVDPRFNKAQFGVEGRKVILTFGLLSPNKGIETMIQALPAIVRSHPDVIYIVLGATHPHAKREAGESYRCGLQRLAHKLGVDNHLMFHDRYMNLSELCEWLGAADVYVTPYLNEDQMVSGTLAYAMGAGNAVVSTPYWYAVEMLAEGRGAIADFGDSEAFAGAVNCLLGGDLERHAMRKRAYEFTRQNVWRHVGRQYLDLFAEVAERRRRGPRRVFVSKTESDRAATVRVANL